MFEGFERATVNVDGVEIALRHGGKGPPLLLLHGYPQTHVMWHKLAPALAERFTVVTPDLRGYGDSAKPAGDPEHATYAKRALAADQVGVMRKLGFERFQLVGHDRGARVAHRLCLDHPDRVSRVVMLDIVPTATMFARTDKGMALGSFHWFFLAQPFDLPERMIGADPDYWLDTLFGRWGGYRHAFVPEAMAEYKRCFRPAATVHATCEDYRAGAGIDLVHDAADADARVRCPLMVLWGAKGRVGAFDPLTVWRSKVAAEAEVTGKPLPCGHFLAEEAPSETLAELVGFLRA